MTGTPSESELFAQVAEEAPVGLAILRPPGILEWANRAYFELTGRDRSLIGIDFHDIPDRDGSFSPPLREALEAALAGRSSTQFRSVREPHNARPGGVHLDIGVLQLITAPRGPPRALLTVRDATDRVEEHSRALVFQQSFLTSTNAMQLTDRSGVMVDVNPAFERIYGYSRAECRGRKPNLVRSRRTPASVYARMWADLLDPARGYWSGEIINRDRKGRERPVLLTITAIRNEEGETTHFLGVTVDLSEQRSWELRAAHADKLASLGQLAAGVAHEINTPLANVMLLAESLRRRCPDPAIQARLATMTEQVEAAARIVRGLLDFARRTEPRITDLDLVEVVQESVEFLRGKQSADVEIETSYPPQPVPISGDRGQLMQVLINILNNAYDAMGGRGHLRLAVRRDAHRAEVEIIDSGPGIPQEAVAHVFEPFFTTKGETGGTGLGLAIGHGIVHAHHGSITARNVLGAGAGFTIVLPLRVAQLPEPAPIGRSDDPAGSELTPGTEGVGGPTAPRRSGAVGEPPAPPDRR
ncbi:MAG: PAS domain-containing sensor histidine kinase [Thermoplasmata archaeon]